MNVREKSLGIDGRVKFLKLLQAPNVLNLEHVVSWKTATVVPVWIPRFRLS